MAAIKNLGAAAGKDGPYKVTARRLGERWYWTRDTLPEAQIVAGHAQLDIERGVDPYARYVIVRGRDAGLTLSQWIDGEWSDGRDVARTTAAGDYYCIKNWIRPQLGPLLITEITRYTIQQFINKVSRRTSPSRTFRVYQTIRKILNAAEMAELIDASPCRRIALPERDEDEAAYLTPAQVVALAREIERPAGARAESRSVRATDQLGLVVIVLAWCGLRWSELAGIRRADVDTMRGLLHIREPFTRTLGGGAHGPGKNRLATKKPLELPPFLVLLLAKHLGDHKHPYLFPNLRGGAISTESFRRAWTRALPLIDGADQRATAHSCRHSMITWLREAGCHERTVDERARHKTGRIQERYTHPTPTTRAAVLTVLEDLWKDANASATRPAAQSPRA